MDFSFESFVHGNFDYDPATRKHHCLWLRDENMDIGGGRISVSDIDKLQNHPTADVVMISGLRQDTFEYFIKTYGKQLKAIRFFKNKFIEDLSLLGTLPQLEYVYFFANQRVTSLWDMRQNESLTGLCIQDFSRLTSISGIETAPALKSFEIGNAVWCKTVVDSLMPLANTGVENLSFSGRAIADNDLSFMERLPCLKTFDFCASLFTTEQVAWIVANFPQVSGYALKPKLDLYESEDRPDVFTDTIIVGKRKPTVHIKGNEARVEKYVQAFETLKEKYRGMSYRDAFPV